MGKEIEEKEDIISSIRQGLERVRYIAKDDTDKWEILEVLEDLYSII